MDQNSIRMQALCEQHYLKSWSQKTIQTRHSAFSVFPFLSSFPGSLCSHNTIVPPTFAVNSSPTPQGVPHFFKSRSSYLGFPLGFVWVTPWPLPHQHCLSLLRLGILPLTRFLMALCTSPQPQAFTTAWLSQPHFTLESFCLTS